jgi:general secretion pathway protein G
MKKAFTMVELVFAIVIIGILASVAVPKLAATRDDAEIVTARTTVAALRTAISTERQKRILRGSFTDITGAEAEALLDYGLTPGWVVNTSTHQFTFTGPSGDICIFNVSNNKLEKDNSCVMVGFGDL